MGKPFSSSRASVELAVPNRLAQSASIRSMSVIVEVETMYLLLKEDQRPLALARPLSLDLFAFFPERTASEAKNDTRPTKPAQAMSCSRSVSPRRTESGRGCACDGRCQ